MAMKTPTPTKFVIATKTKAAKKPSKGRKPSSGKSRDWAKYVGGNDSVPF